MQSNLHAWLNQEKKVTNPNVAGEELRTSGGTYAAVPTNVQALSSGQGINWNFLTYNLKSRIKQLPQDKIYSNLMQHLEGL